MNSIWTEVLTSLMIIISSIAFDVYYTTYKNKSSKTKTLGTGVK